jgi:hypothetical protein
VILPAARLLAVYFATAAVSLWLAHRYVRPLSRGTAAVITLGPFLLVGRALLTAGVHAPIDIAYLSSPLAAHAKQQGIENVQTPLLSDVVYQEVPWRKAVRDSLKNGRLPLWNRFILAGEPLLAVQQPVVLYPATWIGLLLPLGAAWTFEMAMRYFLALLCAWLFLRELGCRDSAALLGAVGWAFADYMVFFLGYPLTPAAAPLPLLLLGLTRLARETERRRAAAAVALTVIALLLILTSGHPESLLHCVAGAGVYFVFELARAKGGLRWRALGRSLVAGALALGLAAVLLLPLAEALPHTNEHFFRKELYAKLKKSVPLPMALARALPDVQPYAYGFAGHGKIPEGLHEPAAFAGAVLWPFAVAGLFSRRREKWGLVALGLLGATVGARFPGITDAISKLPFFDIGLNDRMVFLAAFATAALAALGAERLAEAGETFRGRAVAAGLCLAAAASVWALHASRSDRLAKLELPPEFFRERLLAQTLPLAAAAFVWLLVPRRRIGAAVAASVALLATERFVEEREVYPTYPSAAFYPGVEAFEKIPRLAPFRFAALGFAFVPNVSALYELEDVRGYEAMNFKPLVDTQPLWCVGQGVWFNRVDDPTRPFLSFLNVRWIFAAPDVDPPRGWPVLHRGEEGMLLENPYVLPRAFVPRFVWQEPDPGRRLALMALVTDFARDGLLDEGPGGRPGISNGEAAVDVVEYLPQSLRLSIDAKSPSVVATSVTAWPGWKLTLDGKPAPLVGYNHAFLAFRVPPGRHEARLVYRPDSVVWGAAVSLASLLAAAALWFFWRRVRGRPTSTPRA